MLSKLADKNNSERKELTEWLGSDFDPDMFDINTIKIRLEALRKVKAKK